MSVPQKKVGVELKGCSDLGRGESAAKALGHLQHLSIGLRAIAQLSVVFGDNSRRVVAASVEYCLSAVWSPASHYLNGNHGCEQMSSSSTRGGGRRWPLEVRIVGYCCPIACAGLCGPVQRQTPTPVGPRPPGTVPGLVFSLSCYLPERALDHCQLRNRIAAPDAHSHEPFTLRPPH